MISLLVLSAALQPVSDLGKGELTVDVEGLKLTLRVLTPSEMIAVQKYARAGTEDDTQFAEFIELYKRMVLAYAIVVVGPIDLRDVLYVETGEPPAQEGKPAPKVEKHVAVRKIVETWASTTLNFVFTRYGDLQRRVDIEAERAVQYMPADLDAEIERLESRLAELKKEKEDKLKLPAPPSDAISAVIQASEMAAERNQAVADEVASTASPPPPAPVQAAAPPPPPVQAAPAAPPPVQAAPVQRERLLPPRPAPLPAARPPAPDPRQAGPLDDVPDSFGGDSDEALAAEEARQVMLRSRRGNAQHAGVISPPMGARPPHLDAADVTASMGAQVGSAVAVEDIGGVPAYRLPASVLTDRGRADPPRAGGATSAGKPMVDIEHRGFTNPRFKPPPR